MCIHCMYMYYKCTGNVYTSSLSLEMVYTCIFSLSTCTDSVHTCICFFILVIYMLQHVYTVYIQIQRYSYMVYTGSNVYIQFFHKIKKKYNFRTWTNDLMHTSKLSWPLCYRYATSVLAIGWRFVVLVNCLPGGWWRTSGAGPAAPPCLAMTFPVHHCIKAGVRPRATRRPHWQCCRADDSARRQVD